MRAPTIDPACFTRCPTCGALVSATITDPVCPKQRHRDDASPPPDQSPIERLARECGLELTPWQRYIIAAGIAPRPRDRGPLFTEGPPATYPHTRKEPTHA